MTDVYNITKLPTTYFFLLWCTNCTDKYTELLRTESQTLHLPLSCAGLAAMHVVYWTEVNSSITQAKFWQLPLEMQTHPLLLLIPASLQCLFSANYTAWFMLAEVPRL